MTSCNSILNVPDNTEVDIESDTLPKDDFWYEGTPNYGKTYCFEDVNEFLLLIEEIGEPDWYISPSAFSYLGEVTKVEFLNPIDKLEGLTAKALDICSFWYFIEDMFVIHIYSRGTTLGGLGGGFYIEEIEEENVLTLDTSKYNCHNGYMHINCEGIDTVSEVVYSYNKYGGLDYITFSLDKANTYQTKIYIGLTGYMDENKFTHYYDMSSEEFNKLLNKETLPYALEMMGNVCVYGEEHKYRNIPEEYR